MAVFNVLSYLCPKTALAVCYCWELGFVGTGRNSEMALADLEAVLREKSEKPVNISFESLDDNLVGMFAQEIFFDSQRNPDIIISEAGLHKLHVYYCSSGLVKLLKSKIREDDKNRLFDISPVPENDIPF
ncbi:MAG: hypothetical protein AABW79_01860 [Nanoarchaeota archaeon]